jgi:hypothetical protein
MIKQDYVFDYATRLSVPSKTIKFKGTGRSKWFKVGGDYNRTYAWKRPEEPVLAPTCLSAWSK